jgi:ribosomal protein S18 acetylase RimI-like enzyme
MVDADDHVEPDDLMRLATLHAAALPLSALARMGGDLLVRYYGWVIGSSHDALVIVRGESGVLGAAVVSFAPGSVLRRFALHAPLAFVGALARCAIRDRAFRAEAMAYLRERLDIGRGPPETPELLQIFVDAGQQGRSIGSALLDRVQALLRQRGVGSYYARTLVKDNVRTLGFYERRGFTPVRQLQFCGAPYVLLKKPVPDEQR